jgi:hypothetical protein
VGGERVSVDDFEDELKALSQVEGLAQQPQFAGGATDGNAARFWLTNRVEVMLQRQELQRLGVAVTDDDKAAARAALDAGIPTWGEAPPLAQSILIDLIATQQAFQGATGQTVDEIEVLYGEGVTAIGFVCLRAIAFGAASDKAIEDALAALESGESFADVAAEFSEDPSGAASGGAILSPSGGACTPLDSFAADAPSEVVVAMEKAAPGETVGPISVGNAVYILTQRPFDEVADEMVNTIQGTTASASLQELLTGADVWVNARFGAWNPELGAIV